MARALFFLLLALPGLAAPAIAQAPAGAMPAGPADEAGQVVAAGLSWTDLADLALASPVIFRATVERAGRLSRRVAPDVPEGAVRALVEGKLVSVLKADGLVPGRAEWLWQGEKAAVPQKGGDVLVFANPAGGSGAGREVAQYRLQTARAMLPWSGAAEAAVRAILLEARAPGGVPAFRGVKGGFHVPGAVEGESESQFFLDLGTPVTLVVLRRAGAAPEVKLATGDIIDDSAAPVRRRTLFWRTLACDAPTALPAAVGEDPALRADWNAAKATIGPCGRSLP
jgi:hypothetical protein